MEDTTSTSTTDTSTATVDSTATTQETTATATEPKAPRSFGEAVDQLKAQDEAASTGEPATTAQETKPDTAVVPADKLASKKGPIPFAVHEKALDNARSKAVEEAKPQIEQEIRKQYAWAEAIPEAQRASLSQAAQFDAWLNADPIAAFTWLGEQIMADPRHGPALKSQYARGLATRNRESVEDDEPQPDIPLEDGRAVYSADQQRMRDAWLIKQVSAQFDQKLQPFQQDREQAQHREQLHLVQERAAQTLSSYASKPHFTAHKADVLALMEAHPDWSLGDAYAEVLATKVLPSAEATGRTTALANIHHKAGAGTLNPQQTTTAVPFKPDGKFTTERIRAYFEDHA